MYTSGAVGMRLCQAAEVLTSAAVLTDNFVAMEKVEVKQVGFLITTATVSSGNIVVAVKKRVTAGSASGESTVGTLTIPGGVAAGKIYYKKITPVKLDLGEQIVFEVTTAAAGGGAAGAGYSLVDYDQCPEQPADNTDMVLST